MNSLESFYNEIYIKIGYAVLFLMFLPVLTGTFRWRGLDKALKVFFFYMVSILFYNLLEQGFVWAVNNYTDAWRPYLNRFEIADTNFLNIISRLLDYVFVGWFYSIIIIKFSKFWVKRVSIVVFVVAIVIYFFIDGFRSYGNVNSLINRIFLVAIPLLYLWDLFRSQSMLHLWRNSYFLISIGLLIPNLFGLFLSIVGDKINQTDFVLFVQISLIRNAFTTIGLVLFCFAFQNAKFTKYMTTANDRPIHS